MGRKSERYFRGDRLRELREKSHMSQDELQRLLGFKSRSSIQISRWETGGREPNLASLVRLTKIFDVSLHYLIGQADDPKPKADPLTQEASLNDAERAVLAAYRQRDAVAMMRLVIEQADQLTKNDSELAASV
jgi:transcriptional regulator with XRE-family HTH domain